MTVHQAKGLEWDTVVVAVRPTKRDNTSLINMFNSPSVLGENSVDEFTRIYYVACSRACKALYIQFVKQSNVYNTYYPMFTIMIGTGLRCVNGRT